MAKPDAADAARLKSAECAALAAGASEKRSSVLLAMARSWLTLANQMDRLEAIAKDEAHERRPRRSNSASG